MTFLSNGTEITENFGDGGIDDIKKVIAHYKINIEYLKDDYVLDTYLVNCITSRDLQFVNDWADLFTYLKKIDNQAKELQKRTKISERQKPRELESDIKKLTKAKEVFEKYSDEKNVQVRETIKTLNIAISELSHIQCGLKSYIFKHEEVRPLRINSHLDYYENKLLSKRIEYFKPKPQIIDELINNQMLHIENTVTNINITAVTYLTEYLKDYYKF